MIDSLDRELIDLLVQDARRSSQVLAKKLNVSSSTVRRRMKKLTDQGTIRIIALPEPGRLGLFIEALIALDISHRKAELIVQELRKNPEVVWVAAISGRFDIIALVWLSSIEDLYRFTEEKVGVLEGVTDTETFICLHLERPLGTPG